MTGKEGRNCRWLLSFALLLLAVLITGSLTASSTGAEAHRDLVAGFVQATPTPRPKSLKPKRTSSAARPQPAQGSESLGERLIEELQNIQNRVVAPLATTDFTLIGLIGTATPATQTVPKNVATVVMTGIEVPEGEDPTTIIASLNPDYRIRGELTGPTFTSPRPVEAPIGQPLPIPPLTSVGDHVVQNLRIVDITDPTGATVAPVSPDSCAITVIERVLISQVQVTEMTYEQIVQSGINITSGNYNFFNFTIGMTTSSGTVPIQIPVAIPPTGGQPPIVGNPQVPTGVNQINLPEVLPVNMRLDVNGDGRPEEVELPGGGGQQLQIPGVVVFPGRIGLLRQFFEAIVIVTNGAPNGTPLVVTNLNARVRLPDAGTPQDPSDDPLRIAQTQQGGQVSELAVRGLGPDGRYGTADDLLTFSPSQSGQAAFILEGMREGLHNIDFELNGTLQGLPVGPVNVVGSVPGAVLVKDARFGVTFTHPSVVRSGQEYDLGVTLFNSGDRNINGITLSLPANGVSGATLIDDAEKTINTTIPRGGSATVKWRLRANIDGKVTASYVKVGQGVEAGLNLVTGVGDRNVPLSPDSLILPDAVRHLPSDVVEAARQMLGQAWSVANAPQGTLPPNVAAIDKQTVIAKAIELGWAGLRMDFAEDRDTALRTLVRDWLGENQNNSNTGFADALRNTIAGYYFFDIVGTRFHETLGSEPAADFHRKLSLSESARSPFVSVLASQASGSEIFGAKLISPGGHSIGGGVAPDERFGDLRTGASLRLLGADPRTTTTNISRGWLLAASKPAGGNWVAEFYGRSEGTADISVLAPTTGKNYRQILFPSVPFLAGKRYRVTFRSSGTIPPTVEEFVSGVFQPANLPFTSSEIVDPEPRVVGAVQVTPEVIEGGDKFGRLVGVLFSKPMVKASVETASRYQIGGGELVSDQGQIVGKPIGVTGSSQNFGGRFAIVALNSPIGRYIKRTLAANGASDTTGKTILGSTTEIATRVSPLGVPPGGYVTGRVMNADGAPVANADVYYRTDKVSRRDGESCGEAGNVVVIANRKTDINGEFQFDYVREGECSPVTLLAVNLANNSTKNLTSSVAYDGQHIILNAVFLARGSVQGMVRNGTTPLVNAFVNVIPELDILNSKVVRTDSQGRYSVNGVTVGAVTVRAVGDGVYSLASGIASGAITEPGQTITVNVPTQDLSGSIRGRVLDNSTNQITPIANGLVVARATIPGYGFIPVGYAFTGQDGGFFIGNLPIGNISLTAVSSEHYLGLPVEVPLSPQNKNVDNIALYLSGGTGRVLGRVLNESGQPIPNAVVREGTQQVRSDANGNYVLPSVTVGSIIVSAVEPTTGLSGSVRAAVTRGVDTNGVDIILRRPASLSGQVSISENGATRFLQGALVTVDGTTIAQTDAEGRYSLGSVPYGSGTLRFVYPATRQFINTAVFLNPGESLSRNATFRTGRIHGRVTQPDGTTPAIAPVNLSAPMPNLQSGPSFGLPIGNAALSVQSAQDGTYAFDNLNPGSFRVSTSNSFFPTTVSYSGNLPSGADVEVNLSLADATTALGRVKGHIYRPDGVTRAGAGVRVSLNAPGTQGAGDAIVRTDAGGYYEFPDAFASGNYDLTATDPVGGGIARTGVSIRRSEDTTVNLRLLGRGGLRIRAVDGSGNALPGGVVRVNAGTFPYEERAYELLPADNGRADFANLPEGSYAVSLLHNGLSGRATAAVSDGVSVDVTVQIQTVSGSVNGTVLMPDGSAPVGLADVILRQNGRIIGFGTTPDSEEDRGRFSFEGVPSGEFTIDVLDNRSGRRGRWAGNISQNGQVITADVRLLALGTVTGRVTANGVPAQHVAVSLSADGSGVESTSRVATTDEDGQYRFPGVPVGRVEVAVTQAPGYTSGYAIGHVTGTTEPLPDTVINVALTGTVTVTGTVYRAGGTQIYPGAPVRIRSGDRVVSTAADENGRYNFGFVPLGTVEVRAESPTGYDRGRSSAIVADQPGAVVTADITMTGSNMIQGQALDGNGSPLGAGTVTFTNGDWGGSTYWGYYYWDSQIMITTSVQADGSFSFPDLPSGFYSLRLIAPGRTGAGSATGTLLGGQTLTQNLQLAPAGKIFGFLRSPGGATPAVGADVRLMLVRPGAGSLIVVTHTDPLGRWEFDNLPLGTASVTFTDENTDSVAVLSGLALTSGGQVINAGTVVLDSSRPAVETFTPADGAVDVARDSTVTILFNKALMRSSVGSSSVKILKGSLSIGATPLLTADERTVLLPPPVQLEESTVYTVVVTSSIQDKNGRSPLREYRSTFTTRNDLPPVVASVLPANRAVQVPADSTVLVTVNEPLAEDQNFADLVRVKVGQSPIAGSVTLGSDRKTLRFNPEANLADNTVYTVTVNGLRDAVGNTQTQAFNSTFVTNDNVAPTVDPLAIDGTQTDNPRPSIMATYADNASGVDPQLVNFTFDGVRVTSGLSANGTSVAYTPPQNLALGTHTVSVRVSDYAGNVSSARTAVFTVSDGVPPSVTGTVPVNGATQVALSSTVRVDFDEPLDPNQSFVDVVRVRTGSTTVAGTYSLSGDARSITFTPVTLEASKYYGITVNGQRDVLGNVQTRVYSSVFSTVDTIAPVISSFTINGRDAVDGMTVSTPRPAFAAYFDDEFRIDVNATRLYLGRANEPLQLVPATVSFSSLSYQPGQPLDTGRYKVKVVVVDTAGNQTAREAEFDFSPLLPEIVSVSPDGSPTSGNSVVTIKGPNLISGTVLPQESQQGLVGEYYDCSPNDCLTNVKLVRLDDGVNVDTRDESVVPFIYRVDEAIRWRGKIIPRFTEQYRFKADFNGRLVVKINGFTIVNGLSVNRTVAEGNILLEAERSYDIEVRSTHFYDQYNQVDYGFRSGHLARLWWSSASQTEEIVPASRLRPVEKGAAPQVTVGGQPATVIGAVPGATDEIAIITPPASAGDAEVRVQNENGIALRPGGITYYADTQAPSILSVSPETGAANLPPPARISVTFDEPLAAGLDLGQILRVHQEPDGTEVAGTVVADETARRIGFVPANPLPINTAYRVTVVGQADAVGNVGSQQHISRFSTTDTVPPYITFHSPGTESYSRRPQIRAIFDDLLNPLSFSQLSSVRLFVDDVDVTGDAEVYGRCTLFCIPYRATPGLSYTSPTDLSFGPHTARVRVADRWGNTAESTLNFSVLPDQQGPTITDIYLADRQFTEGFRTAQRRPSVAIVYRDNHLITPSRQKLYFGPQGGALTQVGAVNYVGQVYYAPPQDLPFGFYSYRVELIDDANNSTVRTINFEVADLDITPPQVTVVTPTNGAVQVDPGTNVTITFSEPLDPGQNFALTVPLLDAGYNPVGGSYQLDSGGTVLTFTPSGPLSENATYLVYANGYLDLAGNGGGYFFSSFATTDTVPPEVGPGQLEIDDGEETVQLDGAEVYDRQPRISVNLYDATSGVNVNAIAFTLDGQTVPAERYQSGVYYTPDDLLSYGQHTITIQVADLAGNTTPLRTESFTVSKDPRTPFAVEGDTVLLWRLDERNTSYAYDVPSITPDSTGNRIHGQFPLQPFLTEPTRRNEADLFDPTPRGRFGGRVDRPELTSIGDAQITSLASEGFTVEGWMKMSVNVDNPPSSPYVVWNKGGTVSQDFELLLTPAGDLQARVFPASGDPFQIDLPKTLYDVTDNKWHSLAMAVEAVAGVPSRLVLYADGQPRAEAAIPQSFGSMRISGDQFKLGFGDNSYFAAFDEVRVSSTAHSAETIRKTYNSFELGMVVTRLAPSIVPSGNATDAVVEGYNLDTAIAATVAAPDGGALPVTATITETARTRMKIRLAVDGAAPNGDARLSIADGTATIARDFRIAAQRPFTTDPGTLMLFHLGEPEGSETVANSGSLGGVGYPDSYDDLVGRFGNGRPGFEVGNPAIAAAINSSFTLEVWVKASLPSEGVPLIVYGTDYDGLNTRVVDLTLTTRGQLRASLTPANNLVWRATTQIGGMNLCDDQWHLVSVVVARSAQADQNVMKIFVDGVERGSAAMPPGFNNLSGHSSYKLAISSFGYGGSFRTNFDDFRLLNYARTAADISSSWFGLPPDPLGLLLPKIRNREGESLSKVPAHRASAGNPANDLEGSEDDSAPKPRPVVDGDEYAPRNGRGSKNR